MCKSPSCGWQIIFQEELLIVISPEPGRAVVVTCGPDILASVWHRPGPRLVTPVSWPAQAWCANRAQSASGEYKTISPLWPEYSLTPILHTNWTGNAWKFAISLIMQWVIIAKSPWLNHSDEWGRINGSRDNILWPLGGIMLTNSFSIVRISLSLSCLHDSVTICC